MKYLKRGAITPFYALGMLFFLGVIGGTIVAAVWVWWTALHADALAWNIAAVIALVWGVGIAVTFAVTTVRS